MKRSNETEVIRLLAALQPNRRVPRKLVFDIDHGIAVVLASECGIDEYTFLQRVLGVRARLAESNHAKPTQT